MASTRSTTISGRTSSSPLRADARVRADDGRQSRITLASALRAVGRVRIPLVDMVRQVIVFDAADLRAESSFWAGVFNGHVFEEDDWHSVVDAAGAWRVGVQLAPDHVPPDWPHGTPQQVHLDLHVDDPRAAHEEVLALGARLLLSAPDLEAEEGHQVYADPAGHPFCIGWGHPSKEALASFVAARLNPKDSSE